MYAYLWNKAVRLGTQPPSSVASSENGDKVHLLWLHLDLLHMSGGPRRHEAAFHMWLSEINLIPLYSTSQKTQQLKTDLLGKEKNWIKSQSIKSTSCFPSWVLLPWSHGDGQCAVSVWAVLETMIVKHWAFMPGASPRAVSLERWSCGPSLEVMWLQEYCLKREWTWKSGNTPD